MKKEDFLSLFESQVSQLAKIAITSVDRCLIAQFVALSDDRVKDKIAEKILKGYPYKGAYCLGSDVSITEQKSVVFEFDCPPGEFCLIPGTFLVIVDLPSSSVVRIQDPYYKQVEPTSKPEEREYRTMFANTVCRICNQVCCRNCTANGDWRSCVETRFNNCSKCGHASNMH